MKFLQSKVFAAVLGSILFMLTTAFLSTRGLGPAPATSEQTRGKSGNASDFLGLLSALFTIWLCCVC
jgi:hypothetical protein